MSSVKVTVTVEVDGMVIGELTTQRRVEVDEVQLFNVTRATGGGYVALPSGELDSIKALVLKANKEVTLRLDGQSDAGLVLNAGGMLVVMDATIDAGAATNATVDNASGSDATLKGLVAGS